MNQVSLFCDNCGNYGFVDIGNTSVPCNQCSHWNNYFVLLGGMTGGPGGFVGWSTTSICQAA